MPNSTMSYKICFPTKIMASWIVNSNRQPYAAHSSRRKDAMWL